MSSRADAALPHRRQRAWRGLTAVLCAVLLASAPSAQDRRQRTVRVRVTALAGSDGVFLDRGREDGLRPGLEVELHPPAAAPVRVVVRDLAADSCRATLLGGRALPPVGTPGECEVDAADRGDGRATPPRRAGDPPEHPPWSAGSLPQDPDAPLLAPAFGGGPAGRPTTWDGRVFGQFLLAEDSGSGRDHRTTLARLGTRVTSRNPFGVGGRLRVDGELTRRGRDLLDSASASDQRGRLDQLSYAHGDDDTAPWRLEAGRFVSHYAPELGLLDGLEAALRLDDDWTLGAGAGALPLPFPSRSSGDDVGLHAFARWRAPAGGTPASWTGGYQKTWHRGAADRDLLFTRFDWSPRDGLRVDGSAKVDVYTGADSLKDRGPELTEAWLSTSWRASEALRLGLSGSHYRWAQLRRDELFFAAPELIRDSEVQRLSPRLAVRLGDGVTLRGRADWWRDQDDSGLGGQLGTDLRDVLGAGFDLGAEVFLVDGSYQDGPGLRLRAAQRLGAHIVSARYEVVRWRSDGLAAGDESFTQHRVGASLDLVPADAWTLRVDADLVRGDAQDSLFLGTYVQWRF